MKRWAYSGGAAIVIVVAVVAIALVHRSPSPTGSKDASTATNHKPSTPSQQDTKNAATNGSVSAPKIGTKPLNSINSCDQLLSAAQVTNSIGAKATPSGANGMDDQSADVHTITCDYTGGKYTINVVAHIAQTPVGSSDNDTVFGSAKPADTPNVSDYGQSAYWQGDTGTLNILLRNNWYAVSETAGGNTSLQNTEKLANIVLANL